jgi:hypothetical protein
MSTRWLHLIVTSAISLSAGCAATRTSSQLTQGAPNLPNGSEATLAPASPALAEQLVNSNGNRSPDYQAHAMRVESEPLGYTDLMTLTGKSSCT